MAAYECLVLLSVDVMLRPKLELSTDYWMTMGYNYKSEINDHALVGSDYFRLEFAAVYTSSYPWLYYGAS